MSIREAVESHTGQNYGGRAVYFFFFFVVVVVVAVAAAACVGSPLDFAVTEKGERSLIVGIDGING